jgi:macrolide transport system ATP-binding/permease protein
MLRDLFYRLRTLVNRQRADDELQEELRYHVDREAEKYRAAGLSAEEAKRRAQMAIGGLAQAEQECRDARGTRLLLDMVHDVRFAVRQLRKSPAFLSTAIPVFALGIAACTAIFAFVDATLVKPLPYRDPASLVALFESVSPVGVRFHLSNPDYLMWRQQNDVFGSLDVYRPERVSFQTSTGMEEVSGAEVSDGFFRTLGVAPLLGRDFRPGEDLASAQQTVMLSYRMWQRRFGGDPAILGRSIELDGSSERVIGVLPASFHFSPVEPAEYWRTIHGLCEGNRVCYPFYGVARLKTGVSVATARSNIQSIAARISRVYPTSNRDRGATVLSLTDVMVGDIRPTLLALLCGAALLLLIGFVNIMSLLLVRAESRRREIAVRGALGASRLRLIRQFAVEGFLLAGAGGLLGMTLAYGFIHLLLGLIPDQLLAAMPYLAGLHPGWHFLLLGVLATSLGGTVFTLAPTAQLYLSDVKTGLSEGGRGSADRSWRRIGSSLVVTELAITVVMMASAGLLAKSFYRLLHEDIGLTADHLAVVHLSLEEDIKDTELLAFEREVLSRITSLPGVKSAGVSENLAVEGGEAFKARFSHYCVFGRYCAGAGEEAVSQIAGAGYFETLEARLIRGRYFTEADDAAMPKVALINRTMANSDFPGEDPVGKRIVDQYDKEHPLEVIGVVDDLKDGPLDMKPTPAVYIPFKQFPIRDFYVTVRTSNSERAMLHAIGNAVRPIHAGLIVDGEDTMMERINTSQSAYLHRSAAAIVAGFATLALLLGTVGLYGVVAYSVSRRTREIGVRMALGAQRSSVYRLILREAFRLALAGLAGGLLVSIAVAGLLRSMLFGVSAWDMSTLLAVAGVLVVSALLASFIPARRAASIHPTQALRAE